MLLWLTAGIYLWLAVLLIGIVLSGLFPIGLLLPLDEAKNDQEATSWSSMVLAGGFMVSAIIPILIGVCYDLTGNHTWTYLIFVLLMLGILVTTGLLRKNDCKRHVSGCTCLLCENYFEGMISFHPHSKFCLPSILMGRKK